jgi:hypothetical protein
MEYLNSLISSKHVKTIMDLSYLCCPLALYFKGGMCVVFACASTLLSKIHGCILFV